MKKIIAAYCLIFLAIGFILSWSNEGNYVIRGQLVQMVATTEGRFLE